MKYGNMFLKRRKVDSRFFWKADYYVMLLLSMLIINGCQGYSFHMHALKDRSITSAKSNEGNTEQQLVEQFKNLNISDIKDIFYTIAGFITSDYDKLEEIYSKWDAQMLSILLQQLHHKGLLIPDNFRKVVSLTEQYPCNCFVFGFIVEKMYQRDLLTQKNLKDIMDAIFVVAEECLPAIELAFCKLFEKKLLNQQCFSKIVGHKRGLPHLCDLLSLLDRIGYLNQEVLADLLSGGTEYYDLYQEGYCYKLHTVIENLLKNPGLLQPYTRECGLSDLFCYKDLLLGLFPILGDSQITRFLTQDNLENLCTLAFHMDRWTPGDYMFLGECQEWANAVLVILNMLLDNNLLTERTFQVTIKSIECVSYASRISNDIKRSIEQLIHANLLTPDNLQWLLKNNSANSRYSIFRRDWNLDGVAILSKVNLLTEDNFKALLLHKQLDKVINILKALVELKLLTQDIFQIIMETQGDIVCNPIVDLVYSNAYKFEKDNHDSFKVFITQLIDANLFTANNFKLFLTAKWSMQGLNSSIEQLKNVNLLTEDNLRLLLQSSGYSLNVLKILSKNHLLTQDNFSSLISPKKWNYEKWDQLEIVLEIPASLELLTQDLYQFILKTEISIPNLYEFKYTRFTLRNIIDQLNSVNLFTPNNYKLLLSYQQADFSTLMLSNIIDKLALAKLLTQDNFTLLLSHKELGEMSMLNMKEILAEIVKWNLLTQDIFQILVDSLLTIPHLQKELRSGYDPLYNLKNIISQLVEANLFTADNFKLLLRSDNYIELSEKLYEIHQLTQDDFTKLVQESRYVK